MYENPASYDAQPKRAVDFQSIAFLGAEGGLIGPVPNDPSKANYDGPHFVKKERGVDAGVNDFMYRDVFAQFNSDFSFLVEACARQNLTTRGVTEADLARFHNRLAGAIHRAAPGALVTAAAHSMPYVTDEKLHLEPWRSPARNLYRDALLVAAGGDADGTLDLYQVHSYPVWHDAKDEFNADMMPFARSKSFWGLDKPLLVGEFWNAVGGAGEGSLTADAWYSLFEDGCEWGGGGGSGEGGERARWSADPLHHPTSSQQLRGRPGLGLFRGDRRVWRRAAPPAPHRGQAPDAGRDAAPDSRGGRSVGQG